MGERTLKIAFIVGEESGDLLGADLLEALRLANPGEVAVVGVGGERLQAAGLVSFFDPHEIALMGISAVVKKLPRLIGLIGSTASRIIAEKPDCLVIIDSPDFTHRVARKVRAALPTLPVINYVSPSVWAWRSGRAKTMRGYIDEVLAILPFEVEALERLGGPKATYVGHRLIRDPMIAQASAHQSQIEPDRFADWARPVRLLCLPGSRTGEIERHMDLFGEVLTELKLRNRDFAVEVHVLGRHLELAKRRSANWPIAAVITCGAISKAECFSQSDVALAASGTVTLELALAGIPLISIYKLDRIARMFQHLVTVWTASLPNLIGDQVIVPEYINEMIRPGLIARQIEVLAKPGAARDAQLEGFSLVRERMQTTKPSGEIAAERVLSAIGVKPITS